GGTGGTVCRGAPTATPPATSTTATAMLTPSVPADFSRGLLGRQLPIHCGGAGAWVLATHPCGRWYDGLRNVLGHGGLKMLLGLGSSHERASPTEQARAHSPLRDTRCAYGDPYGAGVLLAGAACVRQGGLTQSTHRGRVDVLWRHHRQGAGDGV